MVPNSCLSVAFEGSNISVSGGNFSGATSKRGGFIYAEDNTRVRITGGLVEDNCSEKRGGAVSGLLHQSLNAQRHRSNDTAFEAVVRRTLKQSLKSVFMVFRSAFSLPPFNVKTAIPFSPSITSPFFSLSLI